jgi:hypothetical protein
MIGMAVELVIGFVGFVFLCMCVSAGINPSNGIKVGKYESERDWWERRY